MLTEQAPSKASNLLSVSNYTATPFKPTLKSNEFFISSAREISSSTSQLTHTIAPLRNFASEDASHTRNWAGSVSVPNQQSP